MSDSFDETDYGCPYLVYAVGEIEFVPIAQREEIVLTELDLRVMLRKVEPAKYNPSGRSVEKGS